MPMSDQVDPDLAANSQWRQPDSGPPQQEHHKHHLPHLHDDHPDPIMHQPPASALATPGLPTISERLYNQDLAPTKQKDGAGPATTSSRCGPTTCTAWATTVSPWVCSRWVWAAGDPARVGCRRRPAVLAADLLRFHGPQDGVPFPVMSRISFGVRGAQIPASAAASRSSGSVSRPTWPRWCYGSC